MSETTDLNNAREQREQSENNNVETREYSETSQTDDAKKQSSNSESVGNSVQEKASLETPHKEIDSNPCSATLVVKTVKTSVSEPAAKISSAPLHNRSPNPVVLGTRVGSSIVPKQGASSLPVVPRTGVVSVNSVAINQPRVTTLTLAKGPVMTTPRTSTPSQSRPLVCSPQTLQLPANFQVPQGMVLIRSDSGQLMLVSQQALAQAQGMLPKLASTRASTVVRPPSSQGAVSGTQTIRVSLPSSSSSSASLKPNSTTATVLQKPSAPAVFTPAGLTGSTIIKSAGVIGSAARKPNIPVATVIKTSAITPNSGKTGTLNLKTTSASAATVINSSVVKSVSKGALPSQSNAPRLVSPNIPSRPSTSTSSGPVKVTAETLENVKKCKNFLVTLMKLASSGTRSADMAQNVRALVKSLLDGKLEAEEFTEKLYMELNSSPQPYLVPFLKRSLPAVRQLTPNSQLFIQQCNQLKPTDSATSTKAPVHKPTPPSGSTLKLSQPIRVTPLVNSTADGAQANSLTTARIPQALAEQGVSAKHPVALPPQNRSQPRHFVIQTSTQSTGAIVRQPILQASKTHFSQPLLPAQAHGFKDSTTGSFRDDDDINDVASMAGVNVSEENARILASGSELVGYVIRSCQEDPFLLPSALQRRALHIGGPHSITGVSPDALQLISLATQQRMKVLLEKLTALAQHREISYKEDWRYCQTSDTRSQLKFLEQLERLEKLRKEEEEREALIRIARSRSNSEDPEQQRLKQRAKEMQQLELAQMEHRDANLAALAALGPRKKKSLEAPGPRANQSSGRGQIPSHHAPVRITFRDLLFCMEQDPALRNSLLLYGAFLH